MLSTIFHDSVNFFYKKILIPEEYVFRLVASVGQKKKKQKAKKQNSESTFTDSKLSIFLILFNLISVFLFSSQVNVALNKLKL